MKDRRADKKSIIQAKKRHTLKVQVVAAAKNKDILAVDFAKGKKHDLKVLRDSHVEIDDDTLLVVDLGYKGIESSHKRTDIPIKKKKNQERTQEEIDFNREVSRERIYIEHINRYLKRFRMLSSRYRNKRRKFALRVTLICGIYNLQH